MFASQIASVSQTSISPLLSQTSLSSSTAMFRSTKRLPRPPRPHHQIRTIRIGIWSSYLEPSFPKEFRRRNRAIKHKYIEALNRKLFWDRENPTLSRQFGFKGFMCSAWRGHDSRPGGRWVSMDKLSPDKHDFQRSNQNGIEDVEQEAVDKVWRKDGFYDRLRYRFTSNPAFSQEVFAQALRFTASKIQKSSRGDNQPSTPSQSIPEFHPEYEIDPITNRKVFKSQSSLDGRKPIEVPVKTFKGYQSQFDNFQPPESKRPERESKPVSSTDNNAQPKQSDLTREYLEDYEGMGTYKPFFAYEPNGEKPDTVKQRDPVEDALREFDSRASYSFDATGISVSEDPVKLCPVQEGLKEYDGRTSYEASPWEKTRRKVSDEASSLDSVQEGLKDYDDRVTYGTRKETKADAATLKTSASDSSLNDVDSKTSYRPVLCDEPFAQTQLERDYGARRILKNISLNRGDSKTDKSFRYQHEIDTREDLDLLRPSDVRAASGIMRGTRKESESEKTTKRKELHDIFERTVQDSCEGTKLPKMSPDVSSVDAKKTENLTDENSQHNGVARKLTGNYVRDFPEEFETNWVTSEDPSGALSPKSQTDAWGYDKTPQGLELSYQQEVEQDVQKAEKEYVDMSTGKEAFARNVGTQRLQTSLDRGQKQESAASKSSATTQAGVDTHSKKPEGLESSYADECDQQIEIDPYSKEPQGLETNYADECAAKEGEGEVSGFVSAYGSSKRDSNVPVKDTSLKNASQWGSRGASPRVTKQPHMRFEEKKQDAALVGELRSIYEESYGTIDRDHRQVPEASVSNEPTNASSSVLLDSGAQEPTVYKILAYDPTMQSISTAETTSIVPDSATALTPADVLLRLSNPAKFFPHFQPLQAEGYEIVSGSGDVLVFRKVRSAGLPGTKSELSSSYEDRTRSRTNPIDGMQSRPIAATGNFASPTGFVNYDRPIPSEPPFKSNIDVRREEPVFSGKSTWSEGGEQSKRKKPGLATRVLLGGAIFGGCSYAIGVVAEYFKSGGMDGLGPRGF